jgi:hypothetical protein
MIFYRFAPFGYLYFSYFSMNEPELGIGIDPGMAFTPFSSSILEKTRQVLNPQPSDHVSSPLTTRPDLRPKLKCLQTLLNNLPRALTIFTKNE